MSATKGVNKEGYHTSFPAHHCPPLRPIGRFSRLVPRQFWPMLTIESRQRILGTLSRIVAHQLALPAVGQEASNDTTDKPRAFLVATPGEGTIAKRMAADLGLRPSPLDDWHFSYWQSRFASSPTRGAERE